MIKGVEMMDAIYKLHLFSDYELQKSLIAVYYSLIHACAFCYSFEKIRIFYFYVLFLAELF